MNMTVIRYDQMWVQLLLVAWLVTTQEWERGGGGNG